MSHFGVDLKTFYRCVIASFGLKLEPNWTLFGQNQDIYVPVLRAQLSSERSKLRYLS